MSALARAPIMNSAKLRVDQILVVLPVAISGVWASTKCCTSMLGHRDTFFVRGSRLPGQERRGNTAEPGADPRRQASQTDPRDIAKASRRDRPIIRHARARHRLACAAFAGAADPGDRRTFHRHRQGIYQAKEKWMNVVSTEPMLTLQDVMCRSSLSRPTIYREIARGKFPNWVSLGGRRRGWRRSDFERWYHDPEGFRA